MPATGNEEWAYWDTKATEFRRKQLDTVQASATRWSTFLTALLGVFSTVAFAGGLTTVDKLPGLGSVVVKSMTTVAALLAVIAIYALARAAGGLSIEEVRGLDADSVRNRYAAGTDTALSLLKWGRGAAIAAAWLVLLGSGIVLWVGEKPKDNIASVLIVADGLLHCGKLTQADGGRITIGANSVNGTITHLVTVDSCP